MKRIFRNLFLFLLTSFAAHSIFAASTTICDGTYALCAYAKCIPIPGELGKAMCFCEVKNGYSIGSKTCQTKPGTTAEGFQTVESRYFPVKKYVSCHNKRPWANCYNSHCIVNPENPKQAFCTCGITKDKGDYMYANDACETGGCESGMISSFVVKDATGDLNSLKKVKNFDKLPSYTPELCPAK